MRWRMPKSFVDMFLSNHFGPEVDRFNRIRKPIIAAVSGYALGGGCELAMMCDFIIASDTAKFGQPEINLGVVAGIGGTQRLTRFVGKSKAMDMHLTGRFMDAAEAERSGLVSRVVPLKKLRAEAMAAAQKIAAKSLLATMAVKDAVNRSYETTLAEGVLYERRLFHSLFATEDQKEGMAAFQEKREAQFRDK
jgi:enoyl-CoA hydratase